MRKSKMRQKFRKKWQFSRKGISIPFLTYLFKKFFRNLIGNFWNCVTFSEKFVIQEGPPLFGIFG